MFPCYCRITGHSRGLPKPNYFPLLPPISPSDAKRFCRVTGKSWNLNPHHYIPIYNAISSSSHHHSCPITLGSSHQEGPPTDYPPLPIESIPITKKCRKGRYKVLTPVIESDEGGSGPFGPAASTWLKEISKNFSESSDHRFVYFIDKEHTALIFPRGIEDAIECGEVEDLALAKDGGQIAIRLSKSKGRESLSLTLQTTPTKTVEKYENDGLLYEGRGPNPAVLAEFKDKKEGSGKGKRKSLGGKVTLFEEKEEKATEEFLKATERIAPDDEKIEEVIKKIEEAHKEKEKEIQAQIQAELAKKEMLGASPNKIPRKYSDPNVKKIETGVLEFESESGKGTQIPGQIIQTNAGPTFIPGQILETEEGTKFFLPGKIVSSDGGNSVKFIPGEVVETEQGLHFLSEDLQETAEGHIEFSLQGFEISPEELKLKSERRVKGKLRMGKKGEEEHTLRPLTPTDLTQLFDLTGDYESLLDSALLEHLSEAGVSIGNPKFVTNLPSVNLNLYFAGEGVGEVEINTKKIEILNTCKGMDIGVVEKILNELKSDAILCVSGEMIRVGLESVKDLLPAGSSEEADLIQLVAAAINKGNVNVSNLKDVVRDLVMEERAKGEDEGGKAASSAFGKTTPTTTIYMEEEDNAKMKLSTLLSMSECQSTERGPEESKKVAHKLVQIMIPGSGGERGGGGGGGGGDELAEKISVKSIGSLSVSSLDSGETVIGGDLFASAVLEDILSDERNSNLLNKVIGRVKEAEADRIKGEFSDHHSHHSDQHFESESEILREVLSNILSEECDEQMGQLLSPPPLQESKQQKNSSSSTKSTSSSTEFNFEKCVLGREAKELLGQAISLAHLMGKNEAVKELQDILSSDYLGLLSQDPEAVFILRQLMVMKRLAGDDPELVQRIVTLPQEIVEGCVQQTIEDPILLDLVQRSSVLTQFVLPKPVKEKTQNKNNVKPSSSLRAEKVLDCLGERKDQICDFIAQLHSSEIASLTPSQIAEFLADSLQLDLPEEILHPILLAAVGDIFSNPKYKSSPSQLKKALISKIDKISNSEERTEILNTFNLEEENLSKLPPLLKKSESLGSVFQDALTSVISNADKIVSFISDLSETDLKEIICSSFESEELICELASLCEGGRRRSSIFSSSSGQRRKNKEVESVLKAVLCDIISNRNSSKMSGEEIRNKIIQKMTTTEEWSREEIVMEAAVERSGVADSATFQTVIDSLAANSTKVISILAQFTQEELPNLNSETISTLISRKLCLDSSFGDAVQAVIETRIGDLLMGSSDNSSSSSSNLKEKILERMSSIEGGRGGLKLITESALHFSTTSDAKVLERILDTMAERAESICRVIQSTNANDIYNLSSREIAKLVSSQLQDEMIGDDKIETVVLASMGDTFRSTLPPELVKRQIVERVREIQREGGGRGEAAKKLISSAVKSGGLLALASVLDEDDLMGGGVAEGREEEDDNSALVFMRDGFNAVVPREKARKILTGEAGYTLVDDEGVHRFESVKRKKAAKLRSFEDEMRNFLLGPNSVGIGKISHDVQISELEDDSKSDANMATKRLKLDEFDLGSEVSGLLDNSASKHKIAVRPKRRPTSPRQHTPKETVENREATIRELIETEEEFVRDMKYVVDNYYKFLDEPKTPRHLSEGRDLIFGNLKQIAEFHSSVLLEGVKYYAHQPKMIGRTFLRLERDFDKHVAYCRDQPESEEYLNKHEAAREYFEDHGSRIGDEKTLLEHLQLPIQRINDYQILLRDLLNYSAALGEETADFEKALELMIAIPQKPSDLKFLNSIEGYRGNIQKLGRLLKHDWFTITDGEGRTKERYLFLFKARILVTKVRRISEDRSIFILKDILKLPDLELEDRGERSFALTDAASTNSLEAQTQETKESWLKEIRQYSHHKLALAEHLNDDLQVEEDTLSKSPTEDPKSPPPIIPTTKKQPETIATIVKEEEKVKVKAISESAKEVQQEKEKVEKVKVIEVKEVKESSSVVQEEKKEKTVVSKKEEEKKVVESVVKKEETKKVEIVEVKKKEEVKELKTETKSIKKEEEEVIVAKKEILKREDSIVISGDRKDSLKLEEAALLGRRKSSIILVRRDSVKSMDERKPKIKRVLKPLECEPGESVKFDFEAEEDQSTPSSVSWFKDNKPLDDKLADRVVIASNKGTHSLKLQNCRDEDSGLYTARITNEHGTSSASAHLNVHEMTPEERKKKMQENSPFFLVKLKDTELLETTTVSFILKVHPADAKISFFKDESPLQTSERVRINKENAAKGSYELIIEHITDEDVGVYKAIAKNSFGQSETSAHVTVTSEKVLFAGLEGKHILEPGEEPSFAWFKDGSEFNPEERFKVMFKDEEDSLALVFQNVKVEDAGIYTCVASTTSGKISCSAELTVQGAVHQLLREPEKPEITMELTDTEVSIGGSAMLELKVKGFPKPNVVWTKDGEEVVAGGRFRFLYEDDESIALIIKGVTVQDAGSFRVVASNDLGEAETTGILLVKAPPKFKTKMKDMSCMTDQAFKMEVLVEGSPIPELKWFKDGKLLMESERIKFVKESNEKFTIIIEKVKMEDSGNWSLVASNEMGQMSEFWNLVAEMPAKIVEKMSEKVEKEEKESVTFSVRVQGVPEPEVKWFKGDGEIKADGSHIEIKKDGNLHTMTIKGLSTIDAAHYTCEVSNQHGKDKSGSDLRVKGAPKITGGLKDLSAKKGEAVEFNIKVNSYPKPKVKWFLDGIEIDGKKYPQSEEGEGNFKLKIPKVEASATVKVKVENEFGSDEASASLTVKSQPVIKEGLKDIRVKESESLEMKVVIEGNPAPNIKWYHNGSEVNADARIKIRKESTEDYYITFNVVIPADKGDWEVKAENELGITSSSCKITVEGKPVFEKRLSETIEVVESEQIHVEVRIDSEPKPSIRWMLGKQEITKSERITILTEEMQNTTVTRSVLKITQVLLEDAGEIVCVAENKHGTAETRGEMKVTALADLKAPKMKADLQDVSVKEGEKVELRAGISGENPDIKWFLNGAELTEGITAKKVGEAEYALQIKEAGVKDAGKYTVKAKNQWGEIESSAKLDVLYKPQIGKLNSVVAAPAEDAVFSAEVKANPEAKIGWRKGKDVIATSDKYKMEKDGDLCKLSIKSPDKNDMDTYTLHAANEIGESSQSAKLTVKMEPPEIAKGLTNLTFKDGESVELKVRIVSGAPKAKVQFTKDGKSLDGIQVDDEKGLYSFAKEKAGPGDVGKYDFIAKNMAGEVNTSCMLKMSQTVPQFGKMLDRKKSVDEGEKFELRVKVDGSPIPAVQWLKDGVPVQESDRVKMSMLPDGTAILSISNAKPSDSGNYQIVAKNANGEASSACLVDVTAVPTKPNFDKDLGGSTDVKTGEPIKLTAVISGFPKPQYKLLKDGKPLRQGAIITEKPDGTIMMEIDSAVPSDRGKYTLVVSNDKGDTAQDISVGVEAPPSKPKFNDLLQDTSVVEGFPLELKATFDGNPTPVISWLKDGKPVDLKTKILENPDGTKVAKVVFTSSPADAGTYTLIATNPTGTTESKAQVAVMSKTKDGPPCAPSFITPLTEKVDVDEGTELFLGGKVEGNPLPDVVWKCEGNPVELSSGKNISNFDGSKVGLRVGGIRPFEGGIYECHLKNHLGSASSTSNVNVKKVYQPPKFSSKITDAQQLPTYDCKFAAKITGIPSPDINWFKDNKPISESPKYRIKRDGDLISLLVRDCGAGDDGIYSCALKNIEGEDRCDAKLEVVTKIEKREKAEAPYFLKKINDCEVYEGMAAKFTACIGGNPEPEFEWYKDEMRLYPQDRIIFEREGAGLLRLIIKKADVPDQGIYRLRIHNPHGSESCEGKLTYDTLESKKRPVGDEYMGFDKFRKTGFPVALADRPIISRMTDRHLTLSWKPSLPDFRLRIPVTYQIEMCECPEGEWITVRKGIRSCACDIRNLEPNRDYKFRIRVENQYGVSEPSPYAQTLRYKLDLNPSAWRPPFHPSLPKDYDLDRPPHPGFTHAPRFLNQEHDTQYAVLGRSSSVFWWVYGYPKPTIKWEYNGVPTDFDYTFSRTGQLSLNLSRMTKDHVGMYEAIATNAHGEARQRVKLAEADHPRFIQRPEETFIMARKGGKLVAYLTGIPEPEIRWYKDWMPLGASTRLKMETSVNEDGFYVAILYLNDAIFRDEGLYSLVATNVAGSIHTSVMVHIEENEQDYFWYSYGRGRDVTKKNRNLSELYDTGDELGRGTQGITRHVVERQTGRSYACKFMRGAGKRRTWMDAEFDIMNGLNHRNISRIVDAYSYNNGLDLVTELSSGGDLLDVLCRQKDYAEYEIADYIRQVLWGLEHLHGRNIAHLGLTPGDLIFSHPEGRDLKIHDFGLARRITNKLASLDYGMPEYVSPEIAEGRGVGYSSDMWSIGIISYLLLGGDTPFRGSNDKETLERIKMKEWRFTDIFDRVSAEGKDFISKLLIPTAEYRLDIKGALRHPWLRLADRRPADAYRFNLDSHRKYYTSLKEWYSNASCTEIYRRRPLSGAYSHPSKMVYPPGALDSPDRDFSPKREPREFPQTDSNYPRPDFDNEIGVVKSESHYQSGPDTYLLQLRDPDFPTRIRQYMKVAASRSPSLAIQLKGAAYDRTHSVIRERRRFTDVMDEEVDDERRTRIAQYGDGPWNSEPRRLRHEVGTRLDAQVEADAILSMKREGNAAFFREKPPVVISTQLEHRLEISVKVAGEPKPSVQWFRNDLIVTEGNRTKLVEDEESGKYTLIYTSTAAFDVGHYRIVARNKCGSAVCRFRINLTGDPGEEIIDSREELDYTLEKENKLSIQAENREKEFKWGKEIWKGRKGTLANAEKDGKHYVIKVTSDPEEALREYENLKNLQHIRIANLVSIFKNNDLHFFVQSSFHGGADVLRVLSSTHQYTEQTVSVIASQILDALGYLHWKNLALLNLEPGNILIDSHSNPRTKITDFSSVQFVSKMGTMVNNYSNNLQFTAPEILNEEPALPQTDIWSLGVVLYILLSGVSPFLGAKPEETRQNILYVRFRFEHLFKEITQEATRFIMHIFKRSPLKRPIVDEAIEHRWLIPSEFMYKKKERAVFLGHRLEDICEEYHNKKSREGECGGSLIAKRLGIREISIGPSQSQMRGGGGGGVGMGGGIEESSSEIVVEPTKLNGSL